MVLISVPLQDPFKSKCYAKSVACHQLNLVKDKHNIILILVHSGLNSFSGVAHGINSLSQGVLQDSCDSSCHSLIHSLIPMI